MISLQNVNKYFFRHKRNEIHVIDDTSLELGKNGLVAFLGPSGCGKTTLLNAIGGLDKIDSGRIYINGKKMPRTGSSKKDKMRVLNIGYIFQNYNLLDNLSVFDNVAMSLKMIGIKNKSTIKNRVNYILECIGMYRYRNKPAGMLSGGQRQRVGIARAIVKNPDIIIADEPTGNLDSKNTIEIMNIIKSISKDKLVILVTHEKELAEFYASRIIRLEDGKVLSDEENVHENELDYRIDNKIYLQDLDGNKKVTLDNKNINFYYDKDENMSLDIVIKNGNVYIRSKEGKKIEVVDENSGIEFVDGKYKKISKEDYEKSTFDLKELDNSKEKIRYTSIYNLFSMFKAGFKKVAGYTLMKKILLVGFFVSSMFIVFSIASIFGVTTIQDKNFIEVHRDYIEIENNQNDLEDFSKIEKMQGIKYVVPGNSMVKILIKNESLMQLKDAEIQMEGSLVDASLLKKEDILYGELPKSNNEIILDKMLLSAELASRVELKMLDLKEPKDFIGYEVQTGDINFKIVGVSDTRSPSIYAFKDTFIDMIASSKNMGGDYYQTYGETYVTNDIANSASSIKNYEMYKDTITLKSGKLPSSDYEVIVNEENKEFMPLGKTIDTEVNGKKLKVVGYYFSKIGTKDLFVSANTFKINTVKTNNHMVIMAEDKETTIETLKKEGFNAKDTYLNSKNNYIESIKDNIIESLIISGILLAISFVEIYLMIRASFLSRIKEVGIYRAIGVKKTDIYKMFLGEILIITTIAGVPGATLMMLILKEITKVSFFTSKFIMDIRVILISFALIYGLNMLVGLLPVRHTIRKTPAEILSRNDVD